VPSMLVPLPDAPGDHQTANARVLERAGGATLLRDGECDGAHLAAVLDGLLDDPVGLGARGCAAAAAGHRDAADAGARVVELNARAASSRGQR
jgi:UDP-N-acetylglucosamine--N-acetylmuramyl-(pentapeptide) pyrophosphoryl-undecaprenol N-acetylglucosamine transferase